MFLSLDFAERLKRARKCVMAIYVHFLMITLGTTRDKLSSESVLNRSSSKKQKQRIHLMLSIIYWLKETASHNFICVMFFKLLL